MKHTEETSKQCKCSKSKTFFLTTTIMSLVIFTGISLISRMGNFTIYVNKVKNESAILENIKKYSKERSLFVPMISPKEKRAFYDAMKAFHEAVRHNVTYFLYGGTLLGSYRHHGMIPWDDDLDLFVREKDRNVLKECLELISPEFELNTKKNNSWKLFHKDSFKTRLIWRWPFLDIFFYLENDTVLWDSHSNWNKYKYPKTDVFPLVKRPFMGMLLPAPKNTKDVLAMQFDIDTCKTNTYNHKKESTVAASKKVQVPCEVLLDLYPFVHRTESGRGTIETLKGGGFHGNRTFVETLFDSEDDDDDEDDDELEDSDFKDDGNE